ncbi:cobalt ECF transporter T component CbiQ, partial [bacterium]|nr:cobalt ECF transporter T component CbiQ [bacterium]
FHLRATEEGCARFLSVLARASLSAVSLATLALSTELPDLVRGLSGLGVPRVIVVTMSFTLRYLSLLRDEARRLALAREIRTFSWRPRLALRAMGHSAGTLFVRTFERAERVHAAMATRGFDGTFPSLSPPRFGAADLALAALAIAAALAIDLAPLGTRGF